MKLDSSEDLTWLSEDGPETKALSETGFSAAELDFAAMETKEWSGPHEGPRGGTYWENSETGAKVYQDEKPDDDFNKDPEDMSDHELVNILSNFVDEDELQELVNADDREAAEERLRDELEDDGGLSEGDEVTVEVSPPGSDEVNEREVTVDQVRDGDEFIGDGALWSEDSIVDDPSDDTSDDPFDAPSDDVPEPPDEIFDEWENEYEDEIAQEAQEHDMDPDEYREALDEEYSRIMENAQPAIRVPSGVLDQILDDGRFKSQFETGSSSGWLDNDFRSEFESEYFGVDESVDPEDRPVYGFASGEDAEYYDEPDDLENYGDVTVKLSDEAKEDATVTFGDSLSGNRAHIEHDRKLSFAPTSAADPSEESIEPGNIPAGHDEETSLGMLQNAEDPTDLSMYNEMQFHGGLSTDDIEEVSIAIGSVDRVPTDQLDEMGIEWEEA